MELQGRVVKLLPLQEGVSQSTGNPWKRQDFLFGFYESGDSIFEKRIKLDVMNDKINELGLQEGDVIKVRVGLSLREYPQGSGKYFNDIRTGDVTIVKRAYMQGAQQPAQPANGGQANNPPQTNMNAPQGSENAGGDADNLPF